VQDIQNNILDIVRRKGPALPTQIASEIQSNSILTGAVLSDLVSKKLVKISQGKIGGSPLYYVTGQEGKLELLYKGLPMREKEAYDIIKKEQIVQDDLLQPAIRVAMNQIKDFAKQTKITIENSEKLFWRWHLLDEQEAILKINKPVVIEQKIEVKEIQTVPEIKQAEIKIETKPAKDNFINLVDNFIEKSGIRVFEKETLKRSKEINMIVSVPSAVGNLKYMMHVRNKKTISDADLKKMHEHAVAKKMPLLVLSNGKLSKKAEKYIESETKGLLLFKLIDSEIN